MTTSDTSDVEDRTGEFDFSGLRGDAPLRDPSLDRLHRRPFAEYLARSIKGVDPRDGFVFALTGPWGSGKTTVVNFTEHFLQKADDQNLLIVHFNPWWISGSDHLLRQFFAQFRGSYQTSRLRNVLAATPKWLDALDEFVGALDTVPGAAVATGPLRSVLRGLSKSAKAVTGDEKDLYSLRKKVDDELIAFPGRIVVFIDDIDRLPQEEVRTVFRLVKAVANFPRTLYVLAYDEAIVGAALNEDNQSGKEYLDKIVQLPLELPAVDRSSLRTLLFEGLDAVLQHTPENLYDQTGFGNLYWESLDALLTTPRRVARFLNRLRATYPPVRGEVHAVDFIAVQALRVFAPMMHAFVAANKDRLCGSTDYAGFGENARDDARKYFKSALDHAAAAGSDGGDEGQKNSIGKILGNLFPRWSHVFGGTGYSADWLARWRRECRICSPEAFDRFFWPGIFPGELSESEYRATLALLPDVAAFGARLKELATQTRPDGITRLRVLLERMDGSVEEDLPIEHVEPLLGAIYTVGDELLIDSDERGMLGSGNDLLMLRVTHQALKRFSSQQERFEILQRAFAGAEALNMVAYRVGVLEQEHGKHTERPAETTEAERTVGLDHLAALESIAAEHFRKAANESWLRKVPHLARVLFRYRDWAGETEVKSYVARLIQDDEGLCDFLVGFLSEIRSQGIGDSVTRRTWRVQPDSVSRFLDHDVNDLLPRCENILVDSPEWLTEQRRRAVETFVNELKNPKDEWGEPMRGRK